VLLEEGREQEVIVRIRRGRQQMHLSRGSVQRTVDDVLHDDAANSRNLLGLAANASNKLGDREAKHGVDNSQPSLKEIFHEVLELSE